jgi:hypothetical protein
MRDRGLIEIPLDDRDGKLLPPLYEYFKSFWSDTSQEPRPLLCGERPCAKIPLESRIILALGVVQIGHD